MFSECPVPARAGIGLRAAHYQELTQQPLAAWVEVHPENFFGAGGSAHRYLERARQMYPLSFHGVGLSLGSVDPLNLSHLKRLKCLIDRYQPALVSEHVSWSSLGGRYLHDLLPLPFTREAMRHLVARIQQVQDFLGRPILIENISSYLRYRENEFDEAEFIAEVARRAGCYLLLDVNNVYVNACNHDFDARAYLRRIPPPLVAEMHLAGFTPKQIGDVELLIDTHNRPVAEAVWALYREALRRFGARPVLIEWDTDLPPLKVLLQEAAKADRILGEEVHDFAG